MKRMKEDEMEQRGNKKIKGMKGNVKKKWEWKKNEDNKG
jgi:hypothetical protein